MRVRRCDKIMPACENTRSIGADEACTEAIRMINFLKFFNEERAHYSENFNLIQSFIYVFSSAAGSVGTT
ncbi:hypothetical protein I4U23_022366 [Adineta vaga]|nr:hypothetical protein I4U23_022366 [Adineta vaga]